MACISLNLDGSRLATASDKGTLVRIFDTQSFTLLQELRRGVDRARIHSIAFNAASSFVACSSDHGTVHIWSLSEAAPSGIGGGVARRPSLAAAGGAAGGAAAAGGAGGASGVLASGGSGAGGEGATATTNQKSTFSFLGSLGFGTSYLQSEWSFAEFRTDETHTLVAFGSEPNTIIIVGAGGGFWKASYEGGGECVQKSYCKFVAAVENREEEEE